MATPLDRLRRLLDEADLDAISLQRRDNFAWFTAGRGASVDDTVETVEARILVTRADAWVITNVIEAPRLMDEELSQAGLEILEHAWYEGEEKLLTSLIGIGRLGSDVAEPGARDMRAEIAALRRVLTEEQQAQYRQLGAEAAAAVEAVCRLVEVGWTEQRLKAEVAREVLLRGIYPAVLLVGVDERIFRYRHPVATNQPVQRYAIVVLCGRRHGLYANLTRFAHFGPVPPHLVARHEAVARVHAAALQMTVPGHRYQDIFQRVVETYAAVGHSDEWRRHHQGGLTGFAPRELIVTPDVAGQVLEGQAFAWNPSIAGAKSEDTLLLTRSGLDNVTMTDDWPRRDVDGHQLPEVLVR